MIIPVILAGGSGSRLWPLSRESFPKQFIPLYEDASLFQRTLERCQGLEEVSPSILIANESHRFLVHDLLQKHSFPIQCTLLEPAPKSTAPAVALAALCALEQTQEDPLLLVLAADHVIEDTAGFHHSVIQGVQAARQGYLVTFGIQPQYPETGYGYIHAEQPLPGLSVAKVSAFKEKPSRAEAEQLIKQGGHYWNSGMFLFRASEYLAELARLQPEMMDSLEAAWKHKKCDDTFLIPERHSWDAVEGESIDYAIMEKTEKAVLLPLQSNWCDVGSWDALSQVMTKDKDGNTKIGDVQSKETHNSLIFAQRRLVATLGLDNMVVVETPDVLFVADKNHSQSVKELVQHLRNSDRKEVLHHSQVHRPWGSFESVDQGERYQVKRIKVNVGAQLSLQMHHHRSEHWVVVRGTARVTRGDEVFMLSENQSTYIPIGVKHRLENIGKIPLEIIEVQSGSYLGEDDIHRFEDQYGRTQEDKKKASNAESV